MTTLQSATIEQLERALAEKREEERRKGKPKPVAGPNWSDLISVCNERIDELDNDEGEDTDTKHYIYEAAMTAVFGDSVWGWIRKHS